MLDILMLHARLAAVALVLTACLSAVGGSHPRGHLECLGSHRDPVGHIDVLRTMPSPADFWERYASQRRPVVFRGAGEGSPGMSLWTDEYLKAHYQDLKVKIESKAEKEDSPAGEKGLGQDTLGNVLASYRHRNVYVVSQLPDPMAREVSVLPVLSCGTFRDRIMEADLWLSAGGTKSLLHRDADNAINCLFAGRKDWILIHPSFEDRIPIAKEEKEAYGGFALLNPDSVDLYEFPAFADVEWSYANLTAGDCLYLPYGYWHQVRSFERNLAVSVLFSRLTAVDLSSCHDDNPRFTPLSEVNMVYTYNGYGDQTMGNSDPFELNETLFVWCTTLGKLDRSDMLEFMLLEYKTELAETMQNHIQNNHLVKQDNTDDSQVILEDITQGLTAKAEKVMALLDTDRDQKVSCNKELAGVSLETLKILTDILDGDTGNTENHEYAVFSKAQISEFLLGCAEIADIGFNGELPRDEFLTLYQDLGGSTKGGKEVFAVLDREGDGFISRDELHLNTDKVLQRYMYHTKDELWLQEWEDGAEDVDNQLIQDKAGKTHLHDDL